MYGSFAEEVQRSAIKLTDSTESNLLLSSSLFASAFSTIRWRNVLLQIKSNLGHNSEQNRLKGFFSIRDRG